MYGALVCASAEPAYEERKAEVSATGERNDGKAEELTAKKQNEWLTATEENEGDANNAHLELKKTADSPNS